ncbi:MAG TPA: hypothetical protein PLS53_02900 [Thermoanaerobaculaceae bacterium]|nr:hypothetical protein [Thermoanaerobaculaceae bacterium]
MSDRVTTPSLALNSVYAQTKPDEPVDLGQWPIHVESAYKVLDGTASVIMRFAPDDRIELHLPMTPPRTVTPAEAFEWPGQDVHITLGDTGTTFNAVCLGPDTDRETLGFMATRSPIRVVQPGASVTEASFHLLNFPQSLGPQDAIDVSGDTPPLRFRRLGRVLLEHNGWLIRIDEMERTQGLLQALRSQGRYVLSHVGQVRRAGDTAFSGDQLVEEVVSLRWFLSFALGRSVGVGLTVGHDSAGNRVFQEWGMPLATPSFWDGTCSWYDRHHGELLSEVFPGFMALWTNALWREPLRRAIYFYLAANDRGVDMGVDTAIIPAQVALEVLAWTYCVLDRRLVSGSKFQPRGLGAAEKLRLLLTTLRIPTTIPGACPTLLAAAGAKWRDGLDAITSIRNSLVHPNARTAVSSDAFFEAWNLSLWYLDLVFLRLCGHNGMYANRLAIPRWVGQVEEVPWAQTGGLTAQPAP